MDELTVRRLFRLAGWACVITIAVLSLLPRPVGVGSEFGAPELDHVFAYFLTAGLIALGHMRTRTRIVVCMLLIGFGGFMELGQAAIPGRDGSIGDFLVNAIGVGMGLVTALHFDRRVLSRAWR
jgi:VanZ family protein